jgi:hypothetical protein
MGVLVLLLVVGVLVAFDLAVTLWGYDSRPEVGDTRPWWPGGHRPGDGDRAERRGR